MTEGEKLARERFSVPHRIAVATKLIQEACERTLHEIAKLPPPINLNDARWWKREADPQELDNEVKVDGR